MARFNSTLPKAQCAAKRSTLKNAFCLSLNKLSFQGVDSAYPSLACHLTPTFNCTPCSTQKFHARTPQPQRSTNVVYRPVGVLGQCEGNKLDFALSSELYHLRALNKLERETTLNLSLLLTWSKVIRKGGKPGGEDECSGLPL